MRAHEPFGCPVLSLLHARHVPVQVELQQNPSTQNPVAHCALPVHALPLGSPWHPPEPSHVAAPVHSSSGSLTLGMLLQVPTLPAKLQA